MSHVTARDAVPLLRTFAQESAWIERVVLAHHSSSDGLDILEAGCGRVWALRLDGRPRRLIGVDLSRAALDHRTSEVGDLDVAIHGDLADLTLDPGSFDVVYSAYVLEHVVGVRRVLENVDRWTRPGGLVVLRLPDPDSVVGRIARMTPYWTHVWYYRHVRRRPLAGIDGRPPFPTVYETAMRHRELERFFADRGYAVVGRCFCRSFAEQAGALWTLARGFSRLVGALWPGVSGSHNNFTIVFGKPAI